MQVERLRRASRAARADGRPMSDGAPALESAGWRRARAARGVPGLALRYMLVERGSGALDARGQGAPARARRTASRAPRRSTCAISRSPGPTGSSSATSASTPTSSATPVEQLALERMKHGGFPQPATCSTTRSRSRSSSPASRCAPSTPTGSRAGSGSAPSAPGEALEGRPGELPHGTLVIADEVRPLALLFGALGARPRRPAEDQAHAARARSRSRACPTSRSRRRSGWRRRDPRRRIADGLRV